MPVDQQVAWLRENAHIVESSHSYEPLDSMVGKSAGPLPWRREVGWSAVYEDNLAAAAKQDYSIDG